MPRSVNDKGVKGERLDPSVPNITAESGQNESASATQATAGQLNIGSNSTLTITLFSTTSQADHDLAGVGMLFKA